MTDNITVSREKLQRMVNAIDMLIPTLGGLRDSGNRWLRKEIIESTDALRAALDATCQDSRHVPVCVDAGMQAAPMQAQFTDDELDLFRQWYNSIQDTNGGYLVEFDHALFRKLRAIKEAPVQVQQKMGKEYIDRLIDSLLLPMGAMSASDVADLHNQCAQMLLLCSKAQPRKAVKLTRDELDAMCDQAVSYYQLGRVVEQAVWAKLGVEPCQ